MKKKQVMQGIGLITLAGVVLVLRHFGVISADSNADQETTQESRQVESAQPADRPSSTQQRPKATKREPTSNSKDGTPQLQESARLERAIDNKESGVIIEAAGVVVKTLPDDNDGDRHQRFIVKLPSGRTVLVAHNIDLAPRVPVHEMDIVEMKGQFEWNDQGGVVHWTHHDPGGWHEDGWIRHDGSIYQ
ncbi:MAG: DUF3465 domain-containing protein [Phycisphaerales bacterium]|nr:DUF3465 domain-containing protein [Phycisphaerales bacterium]